MKLAWVATLCLMASPALADGPYVGGFISGGNYQEMNAWPPNNRTDSVMAGGFAGYGFQAGGFILSPEVRIRAGVNRQVLSSDTGTSSSYPGFVIVDHQEFKEVLGVSIGGNLGIAVGSFSPYVGASIGASRLAYFSHVVDPWGGGDATSRDTAATYSVRAGADYNFDRFFLRAELEQRWFHRRGWRTYRKTEASLGLGIRF